MELEEKLVDHIGKTKFEDFPEEDMSVARNMVLTELGTTVAGAAVEGCETLVKIVKKWGGKQEASLLVHGGKVPAHHAVFANSAMARALDIDDSMVPGMHVGASSVITALAAAELAGGCNGKDFLTALATGQDVATRINFATFYENSEPTWDASGVCGIFASTVAASKILRLNATQLWNALGLTFTQPGGESIQAIVDGTLAVRLFQGSISRNSMLCTLLAQKGFTGPKNFLTGPWGYFHLYSRDKCDSQVLLGDLGKRFELQKTMFKKYPSCGTTIAATDIILSLVKEKGLRPELVERIDVKVIPYTYKLVGKPFEIGEKPTVNAQFSIQYCVANGLLRGESKLKHFEEALIRDPKIMELVEKVHVAPEPGLDGGKRELSLRTEMKVTTRTGEVYHKTQDIPSGFPGNPLKSEEHVERFWDAATYGAKALSKRKVEKIISKVHQLEKMKDVRTLISLLSS